MQAFLATASVIALIVIATNLLLTCGLLVLCIFYVQRMIGRFSGWVETGLENWCRVFRKNGLKPLTKLVKRLSGQ